MFFIINGRRRQHIVSVTPEFFCIFYFLNSVSSPLLLYYFASTPNHYRLSPFVLSSSFSLPCFSLPHSFLFLLFSSCLFFLFFFLFHVIVSYYSIPFYFIYFLKHPSGISTQYCNTWSRFRRRPVRHSLPSVLTWVYQILFRLFI